MDFVITDLGGVTKAALDGRLDTANVDRVELTLTASIIPKAQSTVIDLSQVTFIASLGIRMLLTIARTLAQRGAKRLHGSERDQQADGRRDRAQE